MVNCRAPMQVTRSIPRLAECERSGIILTASIEELLGGPCSFIIFQADPIASGEPDDRPVSANSADRAHARERQNCPKNRRSGLGETVLLSRFNPPLCYRCLSIGVNGNYLPARLSLT